MGISIAVEATPVLSYAMAHNGIPAVSRLTVDGVPADVPGARLRLEVADAAGPIGAPTELVLDLVAGAPAVLTDLTLRLDPAAMLRVEEQRPGTIRATLSIDGEPVAEEVVRTQVLAAHQWLATPPALALELLAAHVMPNDPAVAALLPEIAERLRAVTGSPSVQGYQAGPDRVDEIVAAAYAALAARGIRYAEPPGGAFLPAGGGCRSGPGGVRQGGGGADTGVVSATTTTPPVVVWARPAPPGGRETRPDWADTGQKVRTPGEVLGERVGTCLDTVVLLAAALEQAGIRPLLWMLRGHAVLGWWREEASTGSTAELDPATVLNQVDLGRVGLVETTALTAGVPFAEARRVTVEGADVLGVVDVHQARLDRIVPLPARTRDATGDVHVWLYNPAAAAPAAPAPVPVAAAPGRPAEPPRVTRWKNALLDLSLRNRLIHFTARSGLPLTVPDGHLGTLEDLLHSGAAITLRPSDDLAAVDAGRGLRHGRELPADRLADLLTARRTVHVDVPAGAYPGRMRGLAYRARTITEETGANNLYLSLGTLVWDLDGRALRSPLILVPVTLAAAARGGAYRLTLDETGSATPNYCLLEKLRQLHGIDVTALADPPADGAGIDLDAAFAAVRRTVADHDLPYRVEPTADLAVLQFAKFRLWKDLDENWSAFTRNPLVGHLVDTPTDAFADPVEAEPLVDLDGLDERCPVPADSSQLRAIAEAVAGRTFVLEGPPGTGKSQTITNLLARAVAEGRRVLFVAEKRAALDVVQKRLDAVGMGPLSLDLHDKGSKPAAVREQIARALDHVVVADTQGHDIETQRLRSARRGLTRYAYELHTRNAAGLSLYEAHGAVLGYGAEPAPMPLPGSLLAGGLPGTVDRLRELLGTLPDVADAARPGPRHPWAFVDRASTVDVPAARSAAARLDAVLDRAGGWPVAVRAARSPAQLGSVADLLESGLPLAVLVEALTPRWAGAVAGARDRVAAFGAAPHPGLDAVTPAALDLPVEEIDAAARAAAASGFFGRRGRLTAVRDRLPLRPGVVVKPKQVPDLTADLVRLRAATDELARSVTAIPGLTVPPGWNPLTDPAALDRSADRVHALAAHVAPPPADDLAGAAFKVALRETLAGPPVDPRPVREAADAAAALAAACGTSGAAVERWAGAAGLLGRWQETAPARNLGDTLNRRLDLLRHLEPMRADHVDQARYAILDGTLDPDDARLAFEAGLATASVGERLTRTGLDAFDRTAHERSIARFVDAARSVRTHLRTVLPRQVLDARPYDPATEGGRVGALRRQLGLRRGGLKIRELMTSYGDVVTAALPCVLVSPESLARFFPAEAGLFDIVVFDEASQVRVADAIGAMGRARSVVVVGDSKQLPPTSVAESTIAEDDLELELPGGEVVTDEESILTECVQARVRSTRLSWHYRSQDEALIAFSNAHYYDGGLATFPAPAADGTGVSLVRVAGTFHRSGPAETLRTNPVEAEAVVAEIRRRFAASPGRAPSLGVVTFNLQQRAYIEGLLRDADDQRLLDALEDPDGLFVKNLENVQGDERDVVLFSTAFGVNERGVLPLNFGPLNRAGGERRLNVAVTRARRQVVVFSSFDPAQLRTEQTSSVGLRHLRTYLEMAARGPAVLPVTAAPRVERDRHRDEIAARLAERGVPVRTAVGLSGFALDLVLGDSQVAVLLDGPAWSRRLTARDRDALPAEVLGDVLGWPSVQRVWLPDWLADPDAVLDRLEAALHTPPAPPPPTAPPPLPPAEPEPVPIRAVATEPVQEQPGTAFVPWVVRDLGGVDTLDALPARTAAGKVAGALADVLAAEGPVHADRLARLVAHAYGLTRVQESRRTAILAQLPRGTVRDHAEPDVLWPAGADPAGWTDFRRGADRPLEHVPLRELANAMVALTGAAAGMATDELHRAALAVFGGRRVTTALAARLDAALRLGVDLGRLRLDGRTVHAVLR